MLLHVVSARWLWPLSFGFLWIGVTPQGWQTATSGGLNAAYGLWNIKFFGSGSAFNVQYQAWCVGTELCGFPVL